MLIVVGNSFLGASFRELESQKQQQLEDRNLALKGKASKLEDPTQKLRELNLELQSKLCAERLA